MITFQAIDIEIPETDQRSAKEWINEIAADYGKKIGELYYIFCSDEYLYDFNIRRMNHDFYTDIVTFPLNDCEDYLSGEFYISIDRIRDNAEQLGVRFKDEFHRILAHGLLHLIGYKDKTEEDAATMRKQEEHCLMMRHKDF
ncbi:MAG: rRNA maturation RNase YbeY [Candidatus Limimorpha sp.]